ncbi:MAG: hypothetical protein GY847_31845 [Proteobacteria bacterium]|nr:hypothetical protein [Pseudomonadota bacterium]
MVWRLVSEKVATLREVNTYYDLLDVMDAHEALNIQDKLAEKAAKAAENSYK